VRDQGRKRAGGCSSRVGVGVIDAARSGAEFSSAQIVPAAAE
jgi:hypothetical protein